jgi:hypothetical protein
MKYVFQREIPEDRRFGERTAYGSDNQIIFKGRTNWGSTRKWSGEGRDASLLHILLDRMQ